MIEQYKEIIQQAKGKRNLLEKQLKQAKNERIRLKNEVEATEKAQVLIQNVAQETQNSLKFHIEDIVQMPLEACFPGDGDFKTEFIAKRGRTEARLYLQLQDGSEFNPIDDNGGGLVDVLSFALRISAWSLSKFDNAIVLDEPFKFIDRSKRQFAGKILKELSEKLKLQIIMVTHDQEMIDIADRIFEIKKENEVSYATCIQN